MLWLRLTTVLMDFLGEMASVIWFCGDRSGNFLGLKNSLHYWILVMSLKQIVLLTLLTKLWEKIPWCKCGNRRFRKASLRKCRRFFVFVFFFFTCPFRKVVQRPRRSYRRLWKLGKRIESWRLSLYANESCDEHAVYFWRWRKWRTQLITFWLFGNDVIFPRIEAPDFRVIIHAY